MSKAKMVFYGVLGSLVTVLIWSFIGGCHTSTGTPPAPEPPAPAPEAAAPAVREEPAPAVREVAPPASISRETLIEEGIITESRPRTEPEPAQKPEPVPPAPEAASGRVHTVERGDTLWAIGRRYGVDSTRIAEANRLADPGRLEVGQQLVIP